MRLPRPARASTTAVVLAVTASVALASCGGGGGDDKKSYQASLNTFCANLLAKQGSLGADVQKAAGGAGTNPGKAADALGDVLRQYGSTLTTELAKLKKAKVPDAYSNFMKALDAGITQVAGVATKTADKLATVDLSGVSKGDTSGLKALQAALTDLSKQSNPLQNLEAPKDLKKNAPKCDQLSQN